MRYPAITIVTLNYNGYRDTVRCINSILQTKYPRLTVIVVDNGSTRNEALLLSKKFPQSKISFVRFNKNFGFTEGNNRILRTINTKYTVLLNNDTIVPEEFLKPLIRVMEKDRKIAVTQPKILWAKNKQYFDYAGASGGYIDMFGYPFTRGRVFNTLEKDNGQYDAVQDIFWASGAAMAMRTSIFKKIGYFDNTFFNYMEEIDLCFRINKAGFRIVSVPKVFVYHKVASTSSRNEPDKRFWEHRNNLLMVVKNFPISILAWMLPMRIAMDFLAILYYFYSKRTDYALSVLKSHVSFITLLPKAILARTKGNVKSKKRVHELIYPGSIVWSYFILKKRKFSEVYW